MVSSRLSQPSPGDGGVTECASALEDVHLGEHISLSFNEQFFALVAVGIAPLVARDISQVHVMHPFSNGQIPELFHGRHGRGRQSGQLVLGEEPQEV